MSGIIVVRGGTTPPPPPPPPPPSNETAFVVTIRGSDGTRWNLNNGPVTLAPGVKLFDGAPVTHWLKSSPGVPGARWTGLQVEEQSFTLPVTTRGTDWADWRDVDKAFFASLAPDQEVQVIVRSPDSVSKAITCHLVTVGDISDDMDPLLVNFREYQLGFVAPSPFWRGTPVTQVVTFGDMRPLFYGPPFAINSSTQTLSTTITNAGDVPAWPQYSIGGPCDSWTVGVGDSLVSSSAVPTGSNHIYIDSAPGVRTIVDGAGNRQYQNMDQIAFAPIPPGVSVPVVATMTNPGTGSQIEVSLTPQYWRPL